MTSLFRDSPALGQHLFEQCIGASLPDDMHLRLSSAQFTDLAPPEYSADAVYLIEDQREQTSGAVIIEIQLGRSRSKPRSWLQYVATLHRQLGTPVTLLVVTTSEDIALWCGKPHIYDHIGQRFAPIVIGPGSIPRITDIDSARALPALAVLSAVIHGNEPGAEHIGFAACDAIANLDSDQGVRYYDLVLNSLNDLARKGLEALMATSHSYQFQTDFLRQAAAQGRDEGRDEGRNEGRAEGRQTALIELLTLKFGELSAGTTERVRNADEKQLQRWTARILTAPSLAEFFSED